mmetsp:Transcript_63257/g.148969  ORF Transcript_63257/g.148969 Transcript_63257/m.148969 type:complete len:643 (+) Transcript_63257:442-2370(+)
MDLGLKLLDVDVVAHAQRLQAAHVLRDFLVAVHLAPRRLHVLLDLLLLLVGQISAATVLDAELEGCLPQRVLDALGPGVGVRLGEGVRDKVGERDVEREGDAAGDDEGDVELRLRVAGVGQDRRRQERLVLAVEPALRGHFAEHRVERLREVHGRVHARPREGLVAFVAAANRVVQAELVVVGQQRLSDDLERVPALGVLEARGLEVSEDVGVGHEHGLELLGAHVGAALLDGVADLGAEAVHGGEAAVVGAREHADVDAGDRVDVDNVVSALHLRDLRDDLPAEEPEADEPEEHPERADEPPEARDRHLVAVPDRRHRHHREPQPVHHALRVEEPEQPVDVALEEPEDVAEDEDEEEEEGEEVDERGRDEHLEHGNLVGKRLELCAHHHNEPVAPPQPRGARVLGHVDRRLCCRRVSQLVEFGRERERHRDSLVGSRGLGRVQAKVVHNREGVVVLEAAERLLEDLDVVACRGPVRHVPPLARKLAAVGRDVGDVMAVPVVGARASRDAVVVCLAHVTQRLLSARGVAEGAAAGERGGVLLDHDKGRGVLDEDVDDAGARPWVIGEARLVLLQALLRALVVECVVEVAQRVHHGRRVFVGRRRRVPFKRSKVRREVAEEPFLAVELCVRVEVRGNELALQK